MRRISFVDKLTKKIARYGDVSIKHSVSLANKTTNNGFTEYTSYNYEYESNKFTQKQKMRSHTFTTGDYISIEANKKFNPETKKFDKGIPNTSSLSYNDAYEIEQMFKIGNKWLVDDKFHDLFKLTENEHKPFGITSKYSTLHHVVHTKLGRGTCFIVIQPYVIQDLNNSYTGILIKNEKGVLGAVTASEFFNMGKLVVNLINNLYSNSLQLINLGIVHETKIDLEREGNKR